MASSQPLADIVTTPSASTSGSYVDWGAILAGAFVAAAISSLFLTFGSAIGLSLSSFHGGSSASVVGIAIAAALWLLWVQVSSFIGGGYVAGRLRRKAMDATPHEVEMRDGGHGLVVWSLGVVIAAVITGWFALAGANIIASSGAQTLAASSTNYYVDRLFRIPATSQASPTTLLSPEMNTQIARIFGHGILAKLGEDDTAYVMQQITKQTGLPEAEAKLRLEQILTAIKADADSARRYGILIAFLTAASLLIGAVGAWWGATMGGAHRDQGIDHRHLTSWR